VIDPRWRTVLTVTPYLVLLVLVAFSVGVEWGDWAHLIVTLILCAAFGAWIFAFRHLPQLWRDRPAVIGVFMTVLIALNLLLVLHDSWFGFLAIATFTFAYSIVPWPGELFAVAATAAVAGLAQSSSVTKDAAGIIAALGIIAVNVVAMCGLSWGLRLAQRQVEKAATEVERSRMAREIHDTLAQGFVGIMTQLRAAEQAPDEESRRRHTDAALTLAQDGLAEARRSVNALRPGALDAARLTEALANVAQNWSERTGIPVQIKTVGEAHPLSTDADVALLRTAQEALANVEQHAVARRVVLTVRSDASGTQLEVRDDGCGFDPADRATRTGRAEDGGYGLVAMRERIESVAGTLVIDSRPGHGTAVRAEVPA
jgi:signal transduction histidine kinase